MKLRIGKVNFKMTVSALGWEEADKEVGAATHRAPLAQ